MLSGAIQLYRLCIQLFSPVSIFYFVDNSGKDIHSSYVCTNNTSKNLCELFYRPYNLEPV